MLKKEIDKILLSSSKFIFVFAILLATLIVIIDRDDFIEEKSVLSQNLQCKEETYAARPDRNKQFNEAIGKNPDVAAWITIPNTQVDWPVLQSTNNDYYFRKDENKNYSLAGCIFADYLSVISPRSKISDNITIYGHNISLNDDPNGKRFAQILKLLNVDVAKKTPYIFLTTKDSSLAYEIFAVYFTENQFDYRDMNMSPERFSYLVHRAKNKSQYIYNVNLSRSDKILTLQTCTYKYGKYKSKAYENTKFVVQAKLISDDAKLKTVADLATNPSPEAPKL